MHSSVPYEWWPKIYYFLVRKNYRNQESVHRYFRQLKVATLISLMIVWTTNEYNDKLYMPIDLTRDQSLYFCVILWTCLYIIIITKYIVINKYEGGTLYTCHRYDFRRGFKTIKNPYISSIWPFVAEYYHSARVSMSHYYIILLCVSLMVWASNERDQKRR